MAKGKENEKGIGAGRTKDMAEMDVSRSESRVGVEEMKPVKRKKMSPEMLSMMEIKWALETTISAHTPMIPKT